MTRVCLLGEADTSLQYELLSRETARDALAAYDIREPFENSLAVETVSLGAAVALLNDLDWYLIRFVEDAFIREPSISETEYLSRDLATAIRNDELDPAESDRFLRVYGIEQMADGMDVAETSGTETDGTSGREGTSGTEPEETSGSETEGRSETDETSGTDPEDGRRGEPGGGRPRLVEPMLVTRTGEDIPEYDLRDVDETLIVRVTESEFGA